MKPDRNPRRPLMDPATIAERKAHWTRHLEAIRAGTYRGGHYPGCRCGHCEQRPPIDDTELRGMLARIPALRPVENPTDA